MNVNELVCNWKVELESLKDKLFDLGSQGDSFQYNILATEALRLSMCINDLQSSILDRLDV